jgi:hypothetical protein
MSADKRSTHTDALATLGTIITDGGRDAIHLAVEPVVAGESLGRGEHIGIVNGKAFSSAQNPKIKLLGIVDPFLDGDVAPGEKFWLIVYPRQITSLRHVWEHPDFLQVEDKPKIDTESEFHKSQAWITTFADQIDQTYNRLMNAADQWVEYEEYTYDNSESYKDHWDKFPEFWTHYEVVRGKAPKSKESFFTCSC